MIKYNVLTIFTTFFVYTIVNVFTIEVKRFPDKVALFNDGLVQLTVSKLDDLLPLFVEGGFGLLHELRLVALNIHHSLGLRLRSHGYVVDC